MKPTILSIDCGTQSIRAILFSLTGEVIDKEQVFYEPYFSLKPGWAEQDPEVWWKGLCKATQSLKQRSSSEFDLIKGVGVTTQRDSMICLDEKGKALRPSMLWLDQRKSDIVYKPGFLLDKVLRLAGVKSLLDKAQRESRSNWIRQNETEIWDKTHKYVQVSGFLNFRLTGNFIDSRASQVGHIPIDYRKQEWGDPKAPFVFSPKLIPIEQEKLINLIDPGEKLGKISRSASEQTGIKEGVSVIAAGSDKGCETLGMGVIDDTSASLSFGTTATVQTNAKKYYEPIPFMPAYPSVISGCWNPEVEIFRGYWMVNWFKKEFAHKEVEEAAKAGIPAEVAMNALLEKSSPGSMGLIVQPYWTPGLGEKHGKGAMIGFGDVHKREHVYRAVIEGLAYALKDGMQRIEKKGKVRFEKITVSGGASQSDEICQISADVFNLPLLRGKTHETSGLGAAITVAYGTGEYASIEEAVNAMVSYQDPFEPNKKNVEIYKELYNEVYLKIYKKLEPLYKKIREITGYPEL